MQQTPTQEIYKHLEVAFQHFNDRLFDSKLPVCLLTVQREKNTMGYFSPLRWSNRNGTNTHEIAVNPLFFAGYPLIEIFQTIVHEQCHLWQFEFGTPSRKTYHNREWSEKMESIGLMPSSTGRPGGKKTGQHMNDYPIDEGLFVKACESLVESGYFFNWVDRWGVRKSPELLSVPIETPSGGSPDVDVIQNILSQPIKNEFLGIESESIPPLPPKMTRMKFSCPMCGINVWGKPSLKVLCIECNQVLISDTVMES